MPLPSPLHSLDFFVQKKIEPVVAFLALLWAVTPIAPALAQPHPPPGVTASSSRQFWVEDESRELRSSVASFADSVRQVWLDALGLREQPRTVIRIVFSRDPRARPREAAAITPILGDNNILEIRLQFWEPSWANTDLMAEWIFQALAVEFTGRSHPLKEGTRTPLAPPWFIQALVQLWQLRREPPAIHLLPSLLSSSRPPTAAATLRQRVLSNSRAELELYRLLALGLWRALDGLPEGKSGLRSLAASLARQELDLPAVLSAFPSLQGQPERLERQWALALAQLTQSTKLDRLTIADSLRQLQSIFNVEVPSRKGTPLRGIAALPELARQRSRQPQLWQIYRSLLELEFRANPLTLPIITQYRLYAEQLTRQPKARPPRQLAQLAELENHLASLASQIEEELDLWVANLPPPREKTSSQPARLYRPNPSVEPRQDAITRALDAAQNRYRR